MEKKPLTILILQSLLILRWILPSDAYVMESSLDTTSQMIQETSSVLQKKFLASDTVTLTTLGEHQALVFYHQGDKTTTVPIPQQSDTLLTTCGEITQSIDGCFYTLLGSKDTRTGENTQTLVQIDPLKDLRVLPFPPQYKANSLNCDLTGKLYLLSYENSSEQGYTEGLAIMDPKTDQISLIENKLGDSEPLLLSPGGLLYTRGYNSDLGGEDSEGIFSLDIQDGSKNLSFFKHRSHFAMDSQGVIHVGENHSENAIFIRFNSSTREEQTRTLPLKKITDLILDSQDNTYILGYSHDKQWQLLKFYLEENKINYLSYSFIHPFFENHHDKDPNGRLLGISPDHTIYARMFRWGYRENTPDLIVRLSPDKQTPEYIELGGRIDESLGFSQDGTWHYIQENTDGKRSLQHLKATSMKPEIVLPLEKESCFYRCVHLANDGTVYLLDKKTQEMRIIKNDLSIHTHQNITNFQKIKKEFTFRSLLNYYTKILKKYPIDISDTAHSQATLHNFIHHIQSLEDLGMPLSPQEGDTLYDFTIQNWPHHSADFYGIVLESMHQQHDWIPYILGVWVHHAIPNAFLEHPEMKMNPITHYKDLEKLQHTQKVFDALQYIQTNQKNWFHRQRFDELYDKVSPTVLKVNLAHAYTTLTRIQDQDPEFLPKYKLQDGLEQVRSSLIDLQAIAREDEEAHEKLLEFTKSIEASSPSNQESKNRDPLLRNTQNILGIFQTIQEIDKDWFQNQKFDILYNQLKSAVFALSREQASSALETLQQLLTDYNTDDHTSWLVPALNALAQLDFSIEEKEPSSNNSIQEKPHTS